VNSPLKINVSEEVIHKIYARVKEFPWHEIPDDGGRSYGANLIRNMINSLFKKFFIFIKN